MARTRSPLARQTCRWADKEGSDSLTVPVDPVAPGGPWAAGPVLRTAATVEVIEIGPNRVAFPLSGADTGGTYSLTDFTMAAPPAPGPPPHVHEDADECVYVLDGTLEMGIDTERVTGSPGAVMLAPRGSLHSLVNVGPGPARIIVVLTPPGYEGFWREMSALRARQDGPPDPAKVLELQRRYHMVTGGEARRYE